MQVDGPAAEGDAVLEFAAGDNIVLVEHIVADEAAVFPFAGHRANPFQRHMICIKLAGILDIVPDAVDDGPQLITDQLIVMNGVMFTAPFNPPIMTAVIAAANDPATSECVVCVISLAKEGGI